MLNRVSTATSATDQAQRGAELVERARGLVPLIAGATDRIDRDREIPADVLDAMHDGAAVPHADPGKHRRRGGRARDLLPRDGGDRRWPTPASPGASARTPACRWRPPISTRRSRASCSATARAAVATGAPSPDAKAIVTDGGYRVTGHWHFASGSRHSQWLGGHATVCEPDGSPRLGPNGKPLEQRTMFFPKSKATITDTWQVIGLRGTGSDDYAVNDLFVPEAYSFTRESDADRRETGPLYRFSIFNMFGMAFCAVALGIARTVLTDFIALAKGKTPHSSEQAARRQQPDPDPGRPVARRGSARRAPMCSTTTRSSTSRPRRGEKVSYAQRLASRGVTCFAIQQAREVVDFVYHAAGADRDLRQAIPFERRFRDLHTVTQQSQAHIENFEALGQSLLGIEPARKL